MLILSRHEGETIVINEEIHIVILKSHNKRVQVGVAAPQSIPVDRYEIFKRKVNGRNAISIGVQERS